MYCLSLVHSRIVLYQSAGAVITDYSQSAKDACPYFHAVLLSKPTERTELEQTLAPHVIRVVLKNRLHCYCSIAVVLFCLHEWITRCCIVTAGYRVFLSVRPFIAARQFVFISARAYQPWYYRLIGGLDVFRIMEIDFMPTTFVSCTWFDSLDVITRIANKVQSEHVIRPESQHDKMTAVKMVLRHSVE